MDRLFRIDFYPQDWLIDTAKLAPDERGIYIQIVCLIYSNRGPIENDAAWLAGLSGCSSRMVRSLVSSLAEKNFIQISGSKIGQKRAENELNRKREHLDESANGGRISAERKRQLKKNKELASSEGENSLRTTSPSPIAIEEKKEKEEGGGGFSSSFPPRELAQFRKQCPSLTEKEFAQELVKVDAWVKAAGQPKNPEVFLIRWLQKAEKEKPKTKPNNSDKLRAIDQARGLIPYDDQ